MLGYTFFPSLMKIFKVKIFSEKIEQFISDSVWKMIKYREENKISRHDLIDTLIRVKNGDLMKNSDSSLGTKTLWEKDGLSAQALMFFLAGYETVRKMVYAQIIYFINNNILTGCKNCGIPGI